MFETLLAGVTLGIHLASVHVPAQTWQNNVNVGLYARTADGWTAGVYRNTLRRTSVYAGYTFEHGPLALTVGAITGYQKKSVACNDPMSTGCTLGSSRGFVSLMAAPSVTLPEFAGIVPRISFIPGIGSPSSSVFHLSMERKF